MKVLVGSLAFAASWALSSASKCTVKEEYADYKEFCDREDCENFTVFCNVPEQEGPCRTKEGWEPYWQYCMMENCDTLYADFCELKDPNGAPPPTTKPTSEPTTPSTAPSTTPSTNPTKPSEDTKPDEGTKPPPAELNCETIAAKHPIPSDMLDANCAQKLVETVCSKQEDCQDEACYVERIGIFYSVLGISA